MFMISPNVSSATLSLPLEPPSYSVSHSNAAIYDASGFDFRTYMVRFGDVVYHSHMFLEIAVPTE